MLGFQCGTIFVDIYCSCILWNIYYYFSTGFFETGAVERAYSLKTGNLVSRSEQNLVDCFTKNAGCDGGWMQDAFDYIEENGVELEWDYPYKARDRSCQFSRSESVTSVSEYVDIPQNESSLRDAVAIVGSVAVSINADSLQHYSGRIFDESECTLYFLDQGVLAAGYGTQNGVPYWLVKNSWGADWGENGYVKMIRNNDNQSGIASA